MLDKSNGIDELFKSGLSKHEVSPPTFVWDSIEEALSVKKKQQKMIWLWRSVAAASVLILLSVSVRVFYKKRMPAQQAIMIAKDVNNVAPSQSKNTFSADEKIVVDNSKEQTRADIISPNTAEVSNKLVNDDVSMASFADEQPKEDSRTMSRWKLLPTIKEINVLLGNDISNSLKINEEKHYYPLYAYEPQKSNKTIVSVGGSLSPTYNSKASGAEPVQTFSTVNTNVSENSVNSLGGGLQLRISKGSRWSFETGVLYAQVGQEVTNAIDQRNSIDHSLVSKMYPSDGALLNSMGSVTVGNASDKMMSSAPGYEFYGNDNFTNTVSMDALKQTLEYIEIPMMARYSLFESFPYLSLSGGLSSNFLIGNTAYAINDGDKTEIGEMDDIKPFVLSSSVGLGLDIPIVKGLNFSLEPRLKYYLSSVNADSNYDFQPYSIGVFGGITFVIK